MTFYFVELSHKITQKTIYKFGITKHTNVARRFQQGFPERVKYLDFDIRIIDYIIQNKLTAAQIESFFLSKYNKDNVNENLSESYNTNNLTGITEMRILNADEINEVKELIALIKVKNDS